jgi:hypothetical protein
MTMRLALAVILIVFGWSQASPAQTPSPPPSNMAIRVTEARKANAALMQQYSWTSRADVLDQGQV